MILQFFAIPTKVTKPLFYRFADKLSSVLNNPFTQQVLQVQAIKAGAQGTCITTCTCRF